MARHEDMTNGPGAREDGRAGTGLVPAPARPSRPGGALRAAAAAAAVLGAGVLLAGCGGNNNSASGPLKVRGVAAPVNDSNSHSRARTGGPEKTETLTSKSGTSSANHSTSTPGSCTTQDLKATIGPNHPGAGQHNHTLVLTNKSGHSCTLRGYAGLAFLNNNDEKTSIDPEHDGSPARTLTLTTGHSAWAPLSYPNPKTTGTPTTTPKTALITLPGQHTPLRTTWNNGPLTTGKASTPKIGTLNPGTGT
ncbi:MULTISPECIES: DUF4232 domain-containing protein [unclassified Streptomyces]|uniref:DUF4232 domain-containing protein n=1 Tax=unclassified Streptomyces TaxID=2593676 RepID=UPI002DD9ECCC|nr:DUF4232 domain-containing protein [Streptomyces sp. NBC_01775]WSB75133.1 DUF4232 domain-containing protein [Streptomyces sp. NBC_01775]WSS45402.1 DUF4232 domain-containing protein [Streptomyces sp. NBC_01187]